MPIRENPVDESGLEWCENVEGREYRASGSFGPSLGHLSLYVEGEAGSMALLGTVTWHGAALERMPQISSVLARIAAELQEAVEREKRAGR
jgi:hypothetical protein